MTIHNMAIVYKIMCIPTGKVYVGWTKLNIEKRWKRHQKQDKPNCYFKNCIKKYGAENFVIEVLFEFEKEIDAITKEIELISELYLNIGRYPNGNGMNMTDGGEGTIGYNFTEEHRKKISIASKGKKHRPETIKKMSEMRKGSRNPAYGHPHTQKQIEAARKFFKENNPHKKGELSHRKGKPGYWKGKTQPPEMQIKKSVGMKGKNTGKRSPETIKKLRECQLKWLSEHPHPSLGNKRSLESREKMRQSRLAYLAKQKA